MTSVLFMNALSGFICMCSIQGRYNNYRGNSMQGLSYWGRGGPAWTRFSVVNSGIDIVVRRSCKQSQ